MTHIISSQQTSSSGISSVYPKTSSETSPITVATKAILCVDKTKPSCDKIITAKEIGGPITEFKISTNVMGQSLSKQLNILPNDIINTLSDKRRFKKNIEEIKKIEAFYKVDELKSDVLNRAYKTLYIKKVESLAKKAKKSIGNNNNEFDRWVLSIEQAKTGFDPDLAKLGISASSGFISSTSTFFNNPFFQLIPSQVTMQITSYVMEGIGEVLTLARLLVLSIEIKLRSSQKKTLNAELKKIQEIEPKGENKALVENLKLLLENKVKVEKKLASFKSTSAKIYFAVGLAVLGITTALFITSFFTLPMIMGGLILLTVGASLLVTLGLVSASVYFSIKHNPATTAQTLKLLPLKTLYTKLRRYIRNYQYEKACLETFITAKKIEKIKTTNKPNLKKQINRLEYCEKKLIKWNEKLNKLETKRIEAGWSDTQNQLVENESALQKVDNIFDNLAKLDLNNIDDNIKKIFLYHMGIDLSNPNMDHEKLKNQIKHFAAELDLSYTALLKKLFKVKDLDSQKQHSST